MPGNGKGKEKPSEIETMTWQESLPGFEQTTLPKPEKKSRLRHVVKVTDIKEKNADPAWGWLRQIRGVNEVPKYRPKKKNIPPEAFDQ